MLKRIFYYFLLFFSLIVNAQSQKEKNTLDSLKQKLAYYQSIDSNSTDVIETLHLLENATRISDLYQCLEYAKMGVKIAEFKNDKYVLASQYNVVGNVYFSLQQYYTAMQYFFKSYKKMVEMGKEDSTGFYMVDIGNCFFADNNNELPVKYYRKAAQVFLKNKNDYGLAVAFNNIGLVKSRIEEQDSALYYFNLGLFFRQKLNNPFLIAHSYRYIGDTYQKKKEYEKALHYLNQALSIILNRNKESYDQKVFYGEIYESIAQVHESQQNYGQAIIFYKSALQAVLENLDNKFKPTVLMQKIATCYLFSKQYDQALKYATKALKIAEKINSLVEKRNCHYILVEIYAKKTNAQKVFAHLESYSLITDSLIKEQSDGKFTRLRIEVEAYQIEKEKSYQDVLYANTMAKMKQRGMIRNIFIACSILLIMIIIALFIVNKRKRKLNEILSEKNIKISQQKEELENSTRFKQQFLANMSHEIRTPMTGIVGMIDFLGNTKLDEKQKEYIEIIRNSSEVLLMIINDILDLSKIESGRMVLRPTVFSIKALVRKTQHLFASLNNKKDLQINFQYGEALPEYIEADELRLMEVITNLVSNAVKFSEKGSITIRISIVQIEKDKMKVKIDVTDTGVGISRENQEQLFDNFTHLNSIPILKQRGSGLGLSISKKLVELMGGEINVESDGKNGSKFWFTFNAKIVKTNPIKESIDKEKNELSRSLNISVLLVEDKIVNQKVISLMLNYYGCETTIASNGIEALEKVNKFKYDIIFMDLQMPVMDGITAVKEMRRLYKTLPPIIALSANILKGYQEKYISEGLDDCLAKPVKTEDLAEMIKKWCIIDKK